jgi:hypothetical protein
MAKKKNWYEFYLLSIGDRFKFLDHISAVTYEKISDTHAIWVCDPDIETDPVEMNIREEVFLLGE